MKRIKIDYGIDLGTTNSSICRMEQGLPVIIKTDTQKDTLPSCVSINKKGNVRVGDSAYNAIKSDLRRATKNWHLSDTNTYIEFKRTMGTDTLYPCSNNGVSYTSEQLSAEVLKTLRSFVADEPLRSVVITVPAKFTVGQKTATLHAASLAGFQQCELLQEPVAAAFAYGFSAENKNGIWMVFDFGGGTFDAALLRAEDGILQVFDTAGDNYLGGKDLDNAIVESLILPYLKRNYRMDGILSEKEKSAVLRNAMKTYAEEAKNQLSFKESEDILSNLGELGKDDEGNDIELDLTLTQQQVFGAMRPVFQKAVNICKELIQRNNLKGSDIEKLILIGGPTYSPLIRKMLAEQISPNVDTRINPMTAVATGAALYASTINAQADETETENGTEGIRLQINYAATSVASSEWVAVKADTDGSAYTAPLQIEIVRNDHAWSSGKNTLYENGAAIEVSLAKGKANNFSIVCYDDKGNRVKCSPDNFNILQGTKMDWAVLPYHIGIAIWDSEKGKRIFSPAKGLEKNKPLAAVGVINGLHTSQQLRPGMKEDLLTIPVYQCEDDPHIERNVALYEYVADIEVTGEEVISLIPEKSTVDITLKVDSSEQMTMDIYFPSIDFTISKTLDTSRKQNISEADEQIPKLILDAKMAFTRMKEVGINIDEMEQELSQIMDASKNSTEKKAVLQHLKEILRKIDSMETGTEWLRVEKEIQTLFNKLEFAYRHLNTRLDEKTVVNLRHHKEQVLAEKDVTIGKDFIERLNIVLSQYTLLYQCIGFLSYCQENFDSQKWKNKEYARRLLDIGIAKKMNNPTEDELYPIASQLWELLIHDNDKSTPWGLLVKPF